MSKSHEHNWNAQSTVERMENTEDRMSEETTLDAEREAFELWNGSEPSDPNWEDGAMQGQCKDGKLAQLGSGDNTFTSRYQKDPDALKGVEE